MKSGNLNFLEPFGPLQACNGTALPLPFMKSLYTVHREGHEFSQFSYGKEASTAVTDLALSNGLTRVGFPSLLSTRRRRYPVVGFQPKAMGYVQNISQVGYSAPSSEFFKAGSFTRIPVAT
jgi:hypothetical protein